VVSPLLACSTSASIGGGEARKGAGSLGGDHRRCKHAGAAMGARMLEGPLPHKALTMRPHAQTPAAAAAAAAAAAGTRVCKRSGLPAATAAPRSSQSGAVLAHIPHIRDACTLRPTPGWRPGAHLFDGETQLEPSRLLDPQQQSHGAVGYASTQKPSSAHGCAGIHLMFLQLGRRRRQAPALPAVLHRAVGPMARRKGRAHLDLMVFGVRVQAVLCQQPLQRLQHTVLAAARAPLVNGGRDPEGAHAHANRGMQTSVSGWDPEGAHALAHPVLVHVYIIYTRVRNIHAYIIYTR